MTTTSSAISATTPRSCVIMITALPNSSCSFSISARICAWAVTSRAQPLRARGGTVLSHAHRRERRHGGGLRVQLHDRQAGAALAGAGLADDAERLALVDGEGDTVDGADHTIVCPEVRLQVVDFEE